MHNTGVLAPSKRESSTSLTDKGIGTTKALLSSAVVSGPIFVGIAILQMTTRTGFDIMRDPLSLLSLGEFGWVQVMNFIITGLLLLAGAIGFRRTMSTGPGMKWGPLLISLFGAGTVVAGFFPPDAAFGFPPGSPQGAPVRLSTHGLLHGIGFDIAFLSLIIVAFVFARRYRLSSQRGWRRFSIATGSAIPLLIVLGIIYTPFMGIAFLLTAVIAFGWLGAVAWQQRTDVRE